jgi:hypothetical protein
MDPDHSSPPLFIKWRVLKSNSVPGSFVETGTHRGLTTLYLSRISNFVVSIEPSATFYAKSQKFLSRQKNIELLFGTSENSLNLSIKLLLEKNLDSINFWLDGHFSSGKTFKGETISPVLTELEIIRQNLNVLQSVVVLIDDVRLFQNSEISGYPNLEEIIDWASLNKFSFSVSKDIAILRRICNE